MKVMVQAPDNIFFIIYTTLCGGMILRLPTFPKFKKPWRKHTSDHGNIHYTIAFLTVIPADCNIEKGKGAPNRLQCPDEGRSIALHSRNLGAKRGWVVSTTPRPLYPRERPGTHCTGGWVGPMACLNVCEKSHPYLDSIPGPSSP
jgi:hypothetical protein